VRRQPDVALLETVPRADPVPAVRGAQADAVVGDGQPRPTVRPGQPDHDAVGLRVLGDVAEQLARGPVEQPVDGRPQVGGPPVEVDVGAEPGARRRRRREVA
jgi:hypothetical protein